MHSHSISTFPFLFIALFFAGIAAQDTTSVSTHTVSLVPPTPPSSSEPISTTATSPSITAVQTTVLTTSFGPSGTSTFSTVITTLVPINTTSVSNVSASTSTTATSTSTAFPSLSTLDPCVSNCLAMSVSQVGCGSITDVSCYCINQNFTSTIVSCISSNCTSQLNAAENLAREFCGLTSPSVSLSFPTPTNVNGTRNGASVQLSNDFQHPILALCLGVVGVVLGLITS